MGKGDKWRSDGQRGPVTCRSEVRPSFGATWPIIALSAAAPTQMSVVGGLWPLRGAAWRRPDLTGNIVEQDFLRRRGTEMMKTDSER